MSNITLPSAISHMAHNQLNVLVNVEKELIHHFIAWAALQGSVLVIDCACAFDAYRVQELIHLEQVFFTDTLQRIKVTRPFTAYQLSAAIKNIVEQPLARKRPLAMILPLHLLYDENIPLREGMRLLRMFLKHIALIKRHSPIVVSTTSPSADMEHKLPLIETLTQEADRIMMAEQITTSLYQQMALL